MELFLFWLILSIVVGVFAGSKSRSGFGWFVLSLFISPIITLILLAILPRRGSSPVSLAGKLKEIDRLREDGIITEDEYQVKRKAIIESA
jgi:hypothetical protein